MEGREKAEYGKALTASVNQTVAMNMR